MHFDYSEYRQFKKSNRLHDFHNCQYMGYDYFVEKGYDIKWYESKCEGKFQFFLCKHLKINRSVVGLLNVPKESKGYDVIYCPLDNHYFILGILKFLRIIKIPIICISHLSFNTKDTKSRKLKLALLFGRFVLFNTFDYIAFISYNLLKRAKEDFDVPKRHSQAINWGADNVFYNSDKSKADYYVAIGQAKRDFCTIINAFSAIPDAKLKVLARGDDVLKSVNMDTLPNNVEIIANPYDDDHWLRMKDIYAGAKASLIPLSESHHIPCGATVITESIASATPVFITATSNNMIDVLKENIGEELKCGDVKGWIDVISKLEHHPEILKTYSENARRLAQTTYNYNLFCEKVESVMKQLVG